jgi:hypothetical protein
VDRSRPERDALVKIIWSRRHYARKLHSARPRSMLLNQGGLRSSSVVLIWKVDIVDLAVPCVTSRSVRGWSFRGSTENDT